MFISLEINLYSVKFLIHQDFNLIINLIAISFFKIEVQACLIVVKMCSE